MLFDSKDGLQLAPMLVVGRRGLLSHLFQGGGVEIPSVVHRELFVGLDLPSGDHQQPAVLLKA